MKKLLFSIILISFNLNATELKLSTNIYDNMFEDFISQESLLAMNVQDADVLSLKSQIENSLKIKLTHPDSDANIQVISEKEFSEILKQKFTMAELEKIADRYDIQKARLTILGVGSVDNTDFFLIVDSQELRTIRQMIHYEFVRRGGKRNDFDPTWFFPHILIGTNANKKSSNQTIKNLKHSYDSRFDLKFVF